MLVLFARRFLIVVACVMTMGQSCQKGNVTDGCTEYDQSKGSVSALIDVASKLKLEGKLTQEEMIKIDQDGALYSKRIKDSCNFLSAGKISYEEYQASVTKAGEDYQRLRQMVLSKDSK